MNIINASNVQFVIIGNSIDNEFYPEQITAAAEAATSTAVWNYLSEYGMEAVAVGRNLVIGYIKAKNLLVAIDHNANPASGAFLTDICLVPEGFTLEFHVVEFEDENQSGTGLLLTVNDDIRYILA